MRRDPTLASILARTKRTPNGCRIWLGATSGRGYPQIRFGPGGRYAPIVGVHRLVIELSGRKIPPGYDAAHDPKCVSRACVNPKHLRPATRLENLMEGRHPSAVAWRKAHGR